MIYVYGILRVFPYKEIWILDKLLLIGVAAFDSEKRIWGIFPPFELLVLQT